MRARCDRGCGSFVVAVRVGNSQTTERLGEAEVAAHGWSTARVGSMGKGSVAYVLRYEAGI